MPPAVKQVERPPVWAMRQAGRWDPEFNRMRSGLTFYEFSEDVERAAQASLLPRRFGVDGIILFYDITTLPVAMGLPFHARNRARAPCPDQPIRTLADVERLDAHPGTGGCSDHSRTACGGSRRNCAANCRCWSSPGLPSPWPPIASAPART